MVLVTNPVYHSTQVSCLHCLVGIQHQLAYLCMMTFTIVSIKFHCAGTLPSSWSGSNSFPELRALGLSNNSLKGPLPASWGSQAQAFPSLEVLEVSYNALNGTLPAGWCGSGFPVSFVPVLLICCSLIAALSVTWNIWNMSGMKVSYNSLNGTLLAGWCGSGFPVSFIPVLFCCCLTAALSVT